MDRLRALSRRFVYGEEYIESLKHYDTERTINICLMGDANVGKSSFCLQYTNPDQLSQDKPKKKTVFDIYEADVRLQKVSSSHGFKRSYSSHSKTPSSTIKSKNSLTSLTSNQTNSSTARLTSPSPANAYGRVARPNTLNFSPEQAFDVWKIRMYESAPGRDYEFARSLVYNKAHVFVICFDVMRRETFENVKAHWVPELNNKQINLCDVLLLGLNAYNRPRVDTDRGKQLNNGVVGSSEVHAFTERAGLGFYQECDNNDRPSVLNVVDLLFVMGLESRRL